MFDLRGFRLRDTIDCAAHIRKIGNGARDMDDVSARIVRFFYEALLDGVTTRPACALVRAYVTHPEEQLDPARRALLVSLRGGAPISPGSACLTLLASAGEQPKWCSAAGSRRHRIIPLSDPSFPAQFPLLAELLDQLGPDRASITAPDPARFADAASRACDVLLVPDAVHSPLLPGQEDFVVPFGVRSVIGFGGPFPSGQVLAVVLFSKVPIAPQIAGMFRLLSLSVRIAMAPFTERGLFSRPSRPAVEVSP